MTNWTDQQLAVIHSPSNKIICSAAAGSGKTAVMIERIVRMLQEGLDPETFLVVTFTNAAAAEMKQKIRERLRKQREDRYLRRALDKLDLMEICTIHSFCQHLIRQEFQAADVDPFFAVCEQARAAKIFSDAFRSACTTLQKEQDPDYTYWKKCFSRNESEEIVKKVHSFMMSLPDPMEWLERSCEDVPVTIDRDHPWFVTAAKIAEEKIHTAQMILRRQYMMFAEPEHGEMYREVWKADSELFHVKQLWAEGQEVQEGDLFAVFGRLPTWSKVNSLEEDWKERYKKYREELKNINAELEAMIRRTPETVERDFGNMRKSLQGLRKITALTAEEFAKRKAKLRVLDFNDLEHYALKILRTEPVGSAVRKRWCEVFVDECQDVSRVQDEIIQRLSSGADGAAEGHLFMVGDVKQSIYRFRLADPGLFLHRQEEYAREDSEGEHLPLQTNFRSRPEILETANAVFRDIMTKETAELDYTDDVRLIPGRTFEDFHPVVVDVLESDQDKARNRLEIAADDVTVRIRELLEEGYHLKDIVILMPRVSGDGKKMADLLEKRGIRVFFDGGVDFYERLEVATFLQLLRLIDIPTLDGPLLTTLKYAPFFFTDEELAKIRLKNPEKNVSFYNAFRTCLQDEGELGDRCREADERIRKWRKLASVTPMSTFVRFLCSDSLHLAMAGIRSAGNTAKQNLQMLCAQAEEAERGGVYTLHKFLAFVQEQAGGGDQRAATALAEGDDVVRIMTMHKSKGLQFPVVFCLGLDGSLSGRGEGSVLADAELGICLKYKKPEYRISRDTAATEIFTWKKGREQLAERIRLLYVAMTRAQERMFLVGVADDSALWTAPAGEYRVLSAKNYMDWIVPALQDAAKLYTGFPQAETPWKISFFAVKPQDIVESQKSYPQFDEWLDSLLSAPPVEGMWKGLQTGPVLSKMQKRSVTSLIRQAEQELYGDEEDEETPEGKRIPERFSSALRRSETGPYPAFMKPTEEKRGAWRGTLMHRFLSLADLDRVRKAGEDPEGELAKILEEMVASSVFTGEEGAAISTGEAAAYFRSPLGVRMLASPGVRREWGFNLYREERNLLVQGVIDCAFLEGDEWVLVDYKTDRVEDTKAFTDEYRPQLKWYAEAIRDLTGKPVKETWLYSLSRGEAYPV